jgi:hypothetical protein
MAMSVLTGDVVRKDYTRTILYNRYGTDHAHKNVNTFVNIAFGEKEEITFGEFLANLFHSIRDHQLSVRDQEALLNILEDNNPPNEALKHAAERYKERYSG